MDVVARLVGSGEFGADFWYGGCVVGAEHRCLWC